MAFNPAPTVVFANWSENGTDITLPLASVPQLTAAEADAATGDSRKVLYGLLHQIHAWYTGLAAGDRPTKVVVSKSDGAVVDGAFDRTYTIKFSLSYSGNPDVAAE